MCPGKGLNFGLRWEALITRDSGDNHRHHSSMLGAWRDLSPYSNHSYDWQSDGRGLMGEGGVSCDVGWNGWPPGLLFFLWVPAEPDGFGGGSPVFIHCACVHASRPLLYHSLPRHSVFFFFLFWVL